MRIPGQNCKGLGREARPLPSALIVLIVAGFTLTRGGGGSLGAGELPKPRATLAGHRIPVIRGFFSPDGKRLVTRAERTLLWDLATGGHVEVGDGQMEPLLFSADGKSLLVSGDIRRELRIYDIASGRISLAKPALQEEFEAMSPDGKYEVLFAQGPAPHGPMLRELATPYDLASARDPLLLKDSSIAINFDPTSISLTGRSDVCVQFSPDSKKLILKDPKANFMIRDCAGGDGGKSITLPESCGTSFAVSPDSKLMVAQCGTKATAPSHANYQIFELATGRRRGALQFDGKGPTFTKMVFSPDSRYIASAAVYTIGLWNAADGKLIGRFEKPKHSMNEDSVYEVRFTADSSKLIATAERTFVFWGIASRQIVATLSYEPPCRFLAISPDGSSIATTAKNGDVLLWDSPGGKAAGRPTRSR